MKNIKWERNATGDMAILHQSIKPDFISVSGSLAIVNSLMQDLSVISANFSGFGNIVYSKLAGISVFDKNSGIFFGIYGSNGIEDGPNYCLRKSIWKRNFKKIELVLENLNSESIFFNSNVLNFDDQKTIKSLDTALLEECNISSSPSSGFFNEKHIYFSVCDNEKSLDCNYRGSLASNIFIEVSFNGLGRIFNSLHDENNFKPNQNSLNVSYTFEKMKFLLQCK